MAKHERQPTGPTPAFWIKLALAANFLAQLLPHWLAGLIGVGVLLLPAWLFRA